VETRKDIALAAVALVALGATLRLLPHAANFAPIGAIALFAGVYLKRTYAVLVPVAAMLVSDYFIGFDSLRGRTVVYGSFALIGLLGWLVSKRRNLVTIGLGSLGASVIFYLVTNFAYFYPEAMYPHNWAGIVSSYYNALPFFRHTILGDLYYTGLLFGSYALLAHRHQALITIERYTSAITGFTRTRPSRAA
jgi:hypothetical protein